ncbi:MAG: SusC/RagA family TonB-linked outer membrane protein [Prevotella sp.]|jgi:TonB-linked SusC/RagA family outer membrane protein|nr:SusC/RagA family TonB-linked outer membrane protein [Prevotella sp.]
MVKRKALFFSKEAVLCLFVVLISFGVSQHIAAQSYLNEYTDSLDYQRNTDSLKVNEKILSGKRPRLIINRGDWFKDTLDVERIGRSPYISLQQYLKGSVPGVYVQENSGEPGVMQSMLIRGLSSPVFSNKDVSGVQPVVFVNGIPLLTSDAYVYGIKSTDVNPIGTGTNPLSGLNLEAIESIRVVKDAAELAKLGPLAANGAILVKLKDGFSGNKNVSVHASGGMSIPTGKVSMTNAGNELAFRSQFAALCTNNAQIAAYQGKMPSYLQNLSDPNFFSEPGWADDYYNMAPLYNVGASIGGGDKHANYIVSAGFVGNGGTEDETSYNKFVSNLALNMVLENKLGFSCLINGSRVARNGNRNLRDRYAEVEYLPDLSTPLPPTADVYRSYLNDYKQYHKNDNLNNMINGYLSAYYDWKSLHLDTRLLLDYNTNVRHVFWPSTLMESVSFVSDYSGYNRRMSWNSTASYSINLFQTHLFDFELQQIIQQDVQHYNYTKAYDGKDDTKPTTSSGGFLYIKRYADKMENTLVSSLFSLNYSYKNILGLKAIARYDGASSVRKDSRWLFSPAFSLNYNLKNHLLSQNKTLSDLVVRASWARTGRFLDNNRFAAGPQYTGEELTGLGQPVVSSYYGYATVARPYNSGWIGNDLGWPYSDKWNVGVAASLFNNRLSLIMEYYNNTDKDLITTVPVAQEYGYKYKYASGMDVRNSGWEATLSGTLFNNPKGFSWDASLSLAYNKNELLKLPEGAGQLIIGNRMLKVGHAIDQFWVYENEGVYANDADVPMIDGNKLSMNGIIFSKNDPIWKNVVNDNVIDENDKVLKGHSTPPVSGSFVNNFKYRRFDLNVNLFFAFGHNALNYRSSQRYNFLTLENIPSLESVKEIFFWQNTNDKNDYPLYNQMSGLEPYRADQDLFLEKLGYAKLRSLTLGYTQPFKKANPKNKNALESIYFYVTANNLFSITDFSGDDPELVDFDGYYRGYGQALSRSVILGLKFNF